MARGTAFEYEVGQSAKAFSLYYERLPSGGVRGEGGTRFVRVNPYDGFFVLGGIFCPVEMKSQKDEGAWPLSSLQPHQKEGLARALHHGACPFVAVNFRRRPNAKGKPVLHNQAFLIPFSRWEACEEECRAAGRVSVAFQWFAGGVVGVPIARLPKHDLQPPVWDLPSAILHASRRAGNPAYEPLVTVLETGFYSRRAWEKTKVEGVSR